MGKMSKEKGKAGEREFAKLLRDQGFEARRGQQFAGGGDSPDVVHNIPGFHFEVKRTERLNLWSAFEQAMEDKKDFEVPIVAHRPNRRQWIAVMDMQDLLYLIRELRQRDLASTVRREIDGDDGYEDD